MQIASMQNARRLGACAALALAFATPALAQESGTLAKVRSSGTITFGYFPNARPVSFTDAAGNADGYAVALCRGVAAAAKSQLGLSNLAVKFVPLSAGADQAVQLGQVDMVCAPVEATLARRARMSFSLPVFLGGSSFLVRRDAPKAFRDLVEGKATRQQPLWRGSPQLAGLVPHDFAVIGNTASDRWLRTRARELHVNANISTVPTLAAGLQRVQNRESAAFVADRSVLLGLARDAHDVTVLDRVVDPTTYALALRRNDDDLRLLVDRTLSGLYRSGKIDGLYGRYFGEEKAGTREWFRQVGLPD
jgi:ABC-type amino acid transport substrate-binding protein